MNDQPKSNCPSRRELESFLQRGLAEESVSSVEDHISSCDLCAETLVQLSSTADTNVVNQHAHGAADEDAVSNDLPGEEESFDLTPPPFASVAVPVATAESELLPFLGPPRRVDSPGTLGAYDVLSVLGRGGMGIVLEAEDPQLHRRVALKVIKPTFADHPQARERFLREARAVAAIIHDNIVSIYHVGEDSVPFLTMPLLDGETLSDRLKHESPLPVTAVLTIAREVADGLEAAHTNGVIHRDIKPSNIWLERSTDRVKLLDFGLARLDSENSQLTGSNVVAGTPEYMAPEQAESLEIDARCDLFSLGAVMYRMLTGTSPFAGDTPLAVLSALANRTPRPMEELNPGVSPELASLVMQLLEKDREQRPHSAREVVDAIRLLEHKVAEESVADSGDERPLTTNAAERVPPNRRKRQRMAMGAAGLGLLVLLTAVVIKLRNNSIEVQTAGGTVVIEANVKDVEIFIDDEEKIGIVDPQDSSRITIEVGPERTKTHRLRVTKGGFTADVQTFTIATLNGRPIKVFLKPEAIPITPPDPGSDGSRPVAGSESPSAESVADTQITIGLPVTVTVQPIAIEPEPLPFNRGEPLVKHALVADPAAIDGVISWTIHSKNHRTKTPCSVLSPDGKHIASACMDMAIRIWNVETGRLVKLLLGHERDGKKNSGAISVCWSPDGRYLASTSMENPLILWDVSSGRMLRRVSCPVELPVAMYWSPDGNRIVVTDGSGSHEGVVIDVRKGEPAYTVNAVSAAWSPDAKTLALGGVDGHVQFLEAASADVLRTINAHTGAVKHLGFTPDGRTLGTGAFEHPYKAESQETAFWDVTNGDCLRRHDGRFFVTFSPDGKRFMTGGMPVSEFWRTETGERLGTLNVRSDAVGRPGWLPNGNRVMAGTLPTIWDVTTGKQVRIFGQGKDGAAYSYRFSPDSRRLLYAYHIHPFLGTALWDLRPLRFVAVPGSHGSVWSPDSSQFSHGWTLKAPIHDAATGEVKLTLGDSQGKSRNSVAPIAFSFDGRKLAKLNSGNDIAIVDIESGRTVQMLNVDTPPNCAAWRPDGKQMAIIDTEGRVQLHDLDSGKVVAELETNVTFWPCLDWSRDGVWLAVSSKIGSFTTWNVDTNESVTHSSGAFLTWMNQDSQYATSTGSGVRIADAATGNQIRQISKLPAGGNISPDGKLYVSSELYTNVFHSGEDGRLLGKVHQLTDDTNAQQVKYMTISPDGHYQSPTIGAENLFVYVVQTAEGQETLTGEQFAEKYDWQNDPNKGEFPAWMSDNATDQASTADEKSTSPGQ